MKINKVTITGADDSIDPHSLFVLSKLYPFVEWGILVSRNSQGQKRFPSKQWMDRLVKYQADLPETNIQLSCHLCGGYVKEVLNGSWKFSSEIGAIWELFKRVQINTHGIKHEFDFDAVSGLKNMNKEIIFQYDGVNTNILNYALINKVNLSALFDMSHGAGVLPEDGWLKPVEGIRCGYAGGLSPDNIEQQMKLIADKVGDYELWIDMETQVRSANDQLFNLSKVETVLQICEKSGYLKQ